MKGWWNMSRQINLKRASVLCGILVFCVISVQDIKAEFIFSEPIKVPNLNTSSSDGGGSLSSDGLEMYLASSHPHGGDDCYSDIYVTTRLTLEDAWSTPMKLDPPVNSDAAELTPCISADGLELYFTDGPSDCARRTGGYGQSDIWVSTRTSRCDSWSEPQNLGSNVNSANIDEGVSISSDGLSLYFHSYPSAVAFAPMSEIYVTERPTQNDPWGPAKRIGPSINSNDHEHFPFISPDNLSLYFARGRWESGDYTYDTYVSRRSSITAPWETPVRFDLVNSSLSEYGLLYAAGGSTLYFVRSANWHPFNASSYPNTIRTMDIWQVEGTPFVDFNEDGFVDVLDVIIMTEHWGEDYPPCDISPFPLGDNTVDAQDLKVLTDYLEDPSPPSE
jgi:hypothetical protein